MTHKTLTWTLGLAGVLGVVAGCQQTRNARLSIGDEPPLLLGVDDGSGIAEATGPSATSLDRSGWSLDPVRVERDEVEHWPTRTRLWPVAVSRDSASRRELGLYPTVESVLETESSGAGAEIFAGPASVVVDAGLWLPRVFCHRPGSIMTSPRPGERSMRWPDVVPDQAEGAEAAEPADG